MTHFASTFKNLMPIHMRKSELGIDAGEIFSASMNKEGNKCRGRGVKKLGTNARVDLPLTLLALEVIRGYRLPNKAPLASTQSREGIVRGLPGPLEQGQQQLASSFSEFVIAPFHNPVEPSDSVVIYKELPRKRRV